MLGMHACSTLPDVHNQVAIDTLHRVDHANRQWRSKKKIRVEDDDDAFIYYLFNNIFLPSERSYLDLH